MPEPRKLKKGDRVHLTTDGVDELGVIARIAGGKAIFVPDGSFEHDGEGRWSWSTRKLPTTVEVPNRVVVSDAPLPAEALPKPDDVMVSEGYTGKLEGTPFLTHDGYAFQVRVYRHGRPTGIYVTDEGCGGGAHIEPTSDREAVDEFRTACDLWAEQYGADTKITAGHEWWAGMFLSEWQNGKEGVTANRPYAMVSPYKLTITLEDVDEDPWLRCEVCGKHAGVVHGVSHHIAEGGTIFDFDVEADADHKARIEGYPDDDERGLPKYIVHLEVPVRLTGPAPEDPDALKAELARCLVYTVQTAYNLHQQPGVVPWIARIRPAE